jgi:mannitol 2-dehydrogenase
VAYRQQLIERFASPAIQDTLARLVAEGSERIPKFLLPVIRDQLGRDGEIERSALVVAAWSVYIEAAHSGRFVLIDPRAERLTAAALRENQHPGAFLELEDVFGDLARNERFRAAYLTGRESVQRLGPLGALQDLTTRAQGKARVGARSA